MLTNAFAQFLDLDSTPTLVTCQALWGNTTTADTFSVGLWMTSALP